MKPQSLKSPRNPDWSYETQVGFPKVLVAGVDEVGRGCLAGPVVAAAVIPGLDRPAWLEKIKDSKLLTEIEREELAPLIRSWAQAFGVAEASRIEIDQLNILRASHLAMKRALEGLKLKPDVALIDGHLLPKNLSVRAQAIIKGDQKSIAIASASILAKVFRDQTMKTLDLEYPDYRFSDHKGYPTPAHKKILQEKGLTPHHRRSFAPVRELLDLYPAYEKNPVFPNLFHSDATSKS